MSSRNLWIQNKKSRKKEIHVGLKNFKCELCKYMTNRQNELQTHIKCVHDRLKEHQCNICGKTYSTMKYLKRHKHKDYKCEFCSKSFSQAERLKNHTDKIHEGSKETSVHISK